MNEINWILVEKRQPNQTKLVIKEFEACKLFMAE